MSNRKKSQQTQGKSSKDLQREKNKVRNRQVQQKTRLEQEKLQEQRKQQQMENDYYRNYDDSDEELRLRDHSAYVRKTMKGLGSPSYSMCHYEIDGMAILDWEMWKEAQHDLW